MAQAGFSSHLVKVSNGVFEALLLPSLTSEGAGPASSPGRNLSDFPPAQNPANSSPEPNERSGKFAANAKHMLFLPRGRLHTRTGTRPFLVPPSTDRRAEPVPLRVQEQNRDQVGLMWKADREVIGKEEPKTASWRAAEAGIWQLALTR